MRRRDVERDKARFGQSYRENKNLIHVKIFNRRLFCTHDGVSALSSVVSLFRIASRKRKIPFHIPRPESPFSSLYFSLLRIFFKRRITCLCTRPDYFINNKNKISFSVVLIIYLVIREFINVNCICIVSTNLWIGDYQFYIISKNRTEWYITIAS